MLSPEHLLESLQEQKKKLEYIIKKWNLLNYENELDALKKEINDELFWQHPNQTEILKKEKYLDLLSQNIQTIQNSIADINTFLNDSQITSDLEMIIEINTLINDNNKILDRLLIQLLLHGADDSKNCYLDINAGAGGTEAQDWALMLLRMYCRFCEQSNFKYSIIDELKGEEAGIKNATIYIEGEFATGLLQSEIGIHRLVRISPFDANKRRHTSFAAVSITPESENIAVTIDPKDLRIDTYRAGGAGGQHVNKTDSAVRITHIPSGIVVQCQNERSQLQNKEQAMKALKSKLYQLEESKRKEEFEMIERKKIEWGSQIRSYVLHPYKMVKDHRTETETSQPDKVLDGFLQEFIESYLLIKK
jgi:peptide chain release factor 2